MAEMMCAYTDFAHSRALNMQIGDWLDKINNVTFFRLTVATTAVVRDVLCMV